MKKDINLKIFSLFLVWRVLLFAGAAFFIFLVPNFRELFPYKNVLLEPSGLPSWIWGFANFDGVHYLRIHLMGYAGSQYSQAFFPLFPALIHLFSFGSSGLITGLLLSNTFLLLSLVFLYKLFCLDYKGSESFKSLLLFLAIPTAFYLGSLYSESLFILLIILSIYLFRKNQYIWSIIFAIAASSTRLVGIFLTVFYMWEIYFYPKKFKQHFSLRIFFTISPIIGVLSYMLFLKISFNNPFYFLSAPVLFGTGRTETITLLPQVIFRYLKILLSVPVNNLSFFNASLELAFTIVTLLILFYSFKKIRMSYWLFSLCCVILPTLTGTLTSMPRYILASFLLIPYLTRTLGKNTGIIVAILAIIEIILAGLYTRGYWIA